MSEDQIIIESRMHLFSTLAEAAETEHNLMCLYLYAMFAMKRTEAEGVSRTELDAIERWRKVILGIALEEMSHLSLVSNLFSALGGTPHFMRPNFPVAPGAYPAGIVVELAPFDLQTLEHFIYLERPASHEMNDADAFKPVSKYSRLTYHDRLTSTAGEYKTVGILYQAIRDALIKLAGEMGEEALFCGNPNRQITPIDSPLRGLIEINDLNSALAAVDTIISQGEGAQSIADSHFERFSEIKTEFLKLTEANPDFKPGRPVARNPLMRKPAIPEGKVYIDHPISARYMDLANAFYGFMLKILVQVYSIEERERAEKHEMLEISFTLMHMMAKVGEALTFLPVSTDNSDCHAGMSFAMDRTLTPFAKENELAIILERLNVYTIKLEHLEQEIASSRVEDPSLQVTTELIESTRSGIAKLKVQTEKLIKAREALGTPQTHIKKPATATNKENLPVSQADVETAESDAIRIHFNAKKCIHTRHCVTELPEVFKANTPGEWLYPGKADAALLAAVIRECPSGALTYETKSPILQEELTPPVNVMRLKENGPYAFLSDLEVDGKKDESRRTLCRCGLSKSKPYCDHSHFDGGFIATGEPAAMETTALSARDGVLEVKRLQDGPLSVKGNVEICAATGHIVLRTKSVNLCRCGHSKTKPVCDGTHSVIGFKDNVPG